MDRDRSPENEARQAAPLVSVVVPTRGRADLLAGCIDSIRAQTVGDIEVIVVVDGPDPATTDFLSNVADDRLTFVTHPESRGVSNARNRGIGVTTGLWLAFCDDDDVWAPSKLAEQLSALNDNPAARWAIAGEIRVHQDLGTATYRRPPTSRIVATALPYSNVVPAGCSGVLADRSLVIELGGFDPRLSILADLDLWMRLNWSSSAAVAAEPLVGYRDHVGAMTRRLRGVEGELKVIREKFSEQLAHSGRPFPADDFYVWAYRRTFRAGDWRGGSDLLVRSSRFRTAVGRHLWERAKRRAGLTDPGVVSHESAARRVAATEYPWLGPLMAAAAEAHGRETTHDGAARRLRP